MNPEYCDKRGIPICEGDLIRSPHFIGARNKMHYLYQLIVKKSGILYMVPTYHLAESLRSGGGECPLASVYADTWTAEIISGYGPKPYVSYEDRPRRRLCPQCNEPYFPLKRQRLCDECRLDREIEREEESEARRKRD